MVRTNPGKEDKQKKTFEAGKQMHSILAHQEHNPRAKRSRSDAVCAFHLPVTYLKTIRNHADALHPSLLPYLLSERRSEKSHHAPSRHRHQRRRVVSGFQRTGSNFLVACNRYGKTLLDYSMEFLFEDTDDEHGCCSARSPSQVDLGLRSRAFFAQLLNSCVSSRVFFRVCGHVKEFWFELENTAEIACESQFLFTFNRVQGPTSGVSARLREMSDLHCPVTEERVSTVKVHPDFILESLCTSYVKCGFERLCGEGARSASANFPYARLFG